MSKPSPLDFRALPINDADLIPFYIGSDISKPFWVTWRDLKRILASTLPTGSGVLLKTNGVTNPVQTLLNLVAGTNMTIVNDGLGNITFTSSGGGAVTSVNGQIGVVILALDDISNVNAPSPTVGQILQWNGTDWIAATVTGTGTVQQVNTGTGLTGGPFTVTGTVSLNAKLAPADSLTGNALKVLRVNAGETAVEYATATGLGTVTSVAATVPNPTNPAFSVAVPNPTTTPSIDITANGIVSQYIRGDGSLANFPSSGGGGSSLNYYLNGSVSQGTLGGVAFRQMSSTPVIGAGTNFSISSDGYIQSFITDASVPNQLLIPAGNWLFEMYFQSSSAGGSPRFYVEIYKLSGGTLSLIASSVANPEFITNGTAVDLYTTAVAVPSTVLLAADRIAVRVYVIHSGRTITLHTEDSNLCEVITTFSTGITALNGLTAQIQNFATGTSGTDFGITSATDTHTFNLPTASATNRGALSSADWSTFNGKFPTPLGTILQFIRGDGSLALIPSFPVAAKFYQQDNWSAIGLNNSSIEYVASLNKLYVTNLSSNIVSILNATTGEPIATVAATNCVKCKYIASVNQIYVTSTSATTIIRIDGTTNLPLTAISVSVTANGVDILEYSATKVFITCGNASGSIMVVNPLLGTVTATITASVPAFPVGMALNTNPTSLQFDKIVIGSNAGIFIFDPTTNAVSTTVANPSSAISAARFLTYSVVDNKYYVASSSNSRLVVLSIATATTFTATFISNQQTLNSVVIDEANDYLFTFPLWSTGGTNIAAKMFKKTTLEPIVTIQPLSQGGASGIPGLGLIDLPNSRIFMVGRTAATGSVSILRYS